LENKSKRIWPKKKKRTGAAGEKNSFSLSIHSISGEKEIYTDRVNMSTHIQKALMSKKETQEPGFLEDEQRIKIFFLPQTKFYSFYYAGTVIASSALLSLPFSTRYNLGSFRCKYSS
jgi:hypothetical protein